MSKTYGYQPPPRSGLLQADQRTSPEIRDKLGEQIRAMYGKPDAEPLPEHLLHLARQLDQSRSGGKP
jgi:hypothetical protein